MTQRSKGATKADTKNAPKGATKGATKKAKPKEALKEAPIAAEAQVAAEVERIAAKVPEALAPTPTPTPSGGKPDGAPKKASTKAPKASKVQVIDSSIVKNIMLLGQGSIGSDKLRPGYKMYMFNAIRKSYARTNYNTLAFEDYMEYQGREATRERFEDLAAIMDEKLHRQDACLFIEKVYRERFLPDAGANRYIDVRTHFTCQFMARVLHIGAGDRYPMRILGFKDKCIIVEARNRVMVGYVIRPSTKVDRDGYCYAARGTIPYTIDEANDMLLLKKNATILVEFMQTPTVTPENVICVCRYIQTIR